MIVFPRAYEVLFELYNSMLIERMRSRRKTKIPTDAQMRALKDAVYYKRIRSRLTSLKWALDPAVVFPKSSDVKSAGLVMQTSSRLAELARMRNQSDAEFKPTRNTDLHPSLRYSVERISLYEVSTRRRRTVNSNSCNARLRDYSYQPYKFQEKVRSRFEGCCAVECKFHGSLWRNFQREQRELLLWL